MHILTNNTHTYTFTPQPNGTVFINQDDNQVAEVFTTSDARSLYKSLKEKGYTSL